MLSGTAAWAAAEAAQVQARLVADSARLEPGGTVHIGVLFEIEPGWHIYWRNPGDGGLATDVRFELPDGLQARDLQWPAPSQFEQPGALTAYGYEGSVLLASEVNVGGGAPSRSMTVVAEASWLACRDVCVLGSARLEEAWPPPVDSAAFARWRAGLPESDPPFGLSTTGGVGDGARTGQLSVWLQWPEPPADVAFFPVAGDAVKVSDVRVQTRGSLTRIDLAVTVLGQRPVGMTAVIAAGDRAGLRRSWAVVVPMAATS